MAETICFEYDREKLTRRAHQRGHNSVQAYLQALIEDDLPNPAEGLREGLREVRLGKGRPASEWMGEHGR
jgi:hypothetical protein